MMGDDYAGGFGWRRTMLEDDDAEGCDSAGGWFCGRMRQMEDDDAGG